MAIWTCPGCGQLRNPWDKTSQGVCPACIMAGRQARPKTQTRQRSMLAFTCRSCGKPTNLDDGDRRIGYCYTCLNTGKWLQVWARQHKVKLKEGPAPRRGQKDVGMFGA